jgi:hypothetical protein
MRKLSLLVGTLGGALAGYILSNDKLRKELSSAKDTEAAARMLGSHLSRDGKKIAKEVKIFVESDDVQKNLRKAKSFAQKKFNEAQKSVKGMMKRGSKKAAKMSKDMTKSMAKGFKDSKVGGGKKGA